MYTKSDVKKTFKVNMHDEETIPQRFFWLAMVNYQNEYYKSIIIR